jgi:meiotically up-regulated gene 157 (Mug157) protein
LAARSDKKDKGINKVTIIEYANLPGILADRFFAILDSNEDNYVDLREFIYVMFKVYYSNFDT